MRLLPTLSLLVALALSGCNVWNQPKNPNWKAATAAEQLDRLLWKAVHDKDWSEVERHLAPVFVGTGPRGETLDHAMWIEYWKNAQIAPIAQVRDFSMGEFNSQMDGSDMVATYVLHFSASNVGQAIPAKGFRIISVWQDLKGGWVLISQTVTSIL